MNYSKIYKNLIIKANDRINVNFYTENHHIIPKCIGGSNDKSNLIALTPEEHFLAHQLLAKMHPTNHGLILAANAMCVHNTDRRINNKHFGWLRRRMSEAKKDWCSNNKDAVIANATKGGEVRWESY